MRKPVKELLGQFFERMKTEDDSYFLHVAKEPPYDGEGGGVPSDMMDGEPDEEGWVRWKVIPSRVSADDLEKLEARMGGELPPALRDFLSYGHFMGIERGDVRLPGVPSDQPFGDLLPDLEAWALLVRFGYVPIADDNNDIGPLCLDFRRRHEDGDCPVVHFDHELLIGLDEDPSTGRAELERLAMPFAGSFAELLEGVFGEDPEFPERT
jgi:hypothetical protein